MVAEVNGKIYVIGGQDVSYVTLASVDVFDPATDTWASSASMNTSRAWTTAVAASNGRIYVIGGDENNEVYHDRYLDTVEEYDPQTTMERIRR
jgi:N-acetylneuraminic acid mutarotase